MATHNEMGREAEELAVNFLNENGFEILHRNWRYSHYEIDIIARKDELLHFIEVKARNDSPAGYPEINVTKKKFRFLLRAADEFLYQNPGYRHVQFNVLSITLFKNKEPEFFLIKDVFL